MRYKIITERKLADIDHEDDADMIAFAEEQNMAFKSIGIDVYDEYLIHFIESNFKFDQFVMNTVNEAIENLAIKDGVDFVRFDNGNYGVVSYYNGSMDAFEIINAAYYRERI